MSIFYKAVQPDGTDFFSGKVQWAPPKGHVGEWVVTHPHGVALEADFSTPMAMVLSVSSVKPGCSGFGWPWRLLEVEPVDGSGFRHYSSNIYRGTSFRYLRELPAHEALGPNGAQVAEFLDTLGSLTSDQWSVVEDAAWVASRDAARDAARDATWVAAWVAARFAARVAARFAAAWSVVEAATRVASRDDARDDARFAARAAAAWSVVEAATRDAAVAYVVRDLLTVTQFEALVTPFRVAEVDLP